MNSELMRQIIAGGERFEVIFARELPEERELGEVLFGLSILHAPGMLIIGVERSGAIYGVDGRYVDDVVNALKAATRSARNLDDLNAVPISDKWLAYVTFRNRRVGPAIFHGLTELQEDILSALIREQRRSRYSSEVMVTEDYKNGWSLTLSGKEGVEDYLLLGEFEETDLHALREEAYVTLLSKPHGYNLSLKRKAIESYEKALKTQPDAPKEQGFKWDLFVSYATEDKEAFVRPLVGTLRNQGRTVWWDEFELRLGDSLRRSIDHGLTNSRFGVVVVSPRFLAKDWPQRELDGLVALEVKGRKVILPVWHEIGADGVRSYSPTLADRVAKAILEATEVGIAPNAGAAPDGGGRR